MVINRNALIQARKSASTRSTLKQTRSVANRANSYGPPPPSPTATKWAGALGWAVSNGTLSGQAQSAYWNSNMHTSKGDITNIGVVPATAPTNLIAAITQGTRMPAMQLGSTSDQVTLANLQAIDTEFQTTAGDGAVSEWVIYGDDQYNGTTAQHITQLQLHCDFIRGLPTSLGTFTRANGAPAFKVLYIPSGQLIYNDINQSTGLLNDPLLASYPDAILIQSQTWEDQPDGANPTYVSIVKNMVSACRAASGNKPTHVQVQVYSKSTPTTVWTATKVEQDIDAIGAACSPDMINIWFADSKASTAATNVFLTVLANYRP